VAALPDQKLASLGSLPFANRLAAEMTVMSSREQPFLRQAAQNGKSLLTKLGTISVRFMIVPMAAHWMGHVVHGTPEVVVLGQIL
jgi:hypothetical protein